MEVIRFFERYDRQAAVMPRMSGYLPGYQKNFVISSISLRFGRAGSSPAFPMAITATTISVSGISSSLRILPASRIPMIRVAYPSSSAFSIRFSFCRPRS